MTVRSGIRSAWLALIKRTLNRLTLRIARSSRGPFTIVQHVGRRSGRTFETPIIVQPTAGGFVIALTYGPDVNWFRNVVAAGGCVLVHHRRRYTVAGIEPMDARQAIAAFPVPQRWILTALRQEDFALLVRG
ncbi:nitroreductase family deazaflavin-dependent oxidoreductase [Subtercola sp. YIM 133946]|uniref:nitroreductase family deazaflavin-dependent oxidoreductase n=1 Tax=Subtercola sp. YIM 133946 TaxID=3118909 RepID=UPI002F92F110